MKTVVLIAMVLSAVADILDVDSAIIRGEKMIQDNVLKVVDLTPDNLESFTRSHPNVLVEFFAPWCGKCKSIAKEYARVPDLVNRYDMPVTIAKVDANAHHEFAQNYGVENLPTLFLFRNFSQYREEFPALTTGEAYVAGLSKILNTGHDISPAKIFTGGPLEVAQWIFWRGTDDGKIPTTLVFYSADSIKDTPASQEMEAVFTSTAKELMRFSNLRFAVVNDEAVLEDFEISKEKPSLILYKDHDEGRVEYSGALDQESLSKWIFAQDTPLVTEVWHRTLQSFRKRVKTLALFFVRESQYDHYPTMQRLKEGLRQVAYALEAQGRFKRGEFTIGIANGEKYSSWMRHFSLDVDRIPAMSIENTLSDAFYAVPDFAEIASSNIPKRPEPTAEDAEQQPEPFIEYRPAPFMPEAEHKPKDDRIVWVDVPVDVLIKHLEGYFDGSLEAVPVKDEL